MTMKEALTNEALLRAYGAVARRYDLQHTLLTARSDQRGRELLVREAVREGDEVLDCGAGTGSTGLLAAQKVGASGRVTLFDLSEEMLRVAKDKAARAGVEDRVTFGTGDLLELPFPDDSFDVVLSTYSLCPVYDPAKGAEEMYRVTRPGGLIGVAHSSEPANPVVHWVADRVERIAWRFPSISLGCRSVNVLPTYEETGCSILFKRAIGVPLWPFLVFVAEKPRDRPGA